MSREEQFLTSIQQAAHIFNKHVKLGNTVRIVTHNDADGISSGGILSVTTQRAGVPFKTSCHKKLDENLLIAIMNENLKIIIFSDFGSGYLDDISKILAGSDIIVFDHHHVQDTEQYNKIIHINPHIHGIDGSRELASSGICYLFSKLVDQLNVDLSCLGLVGALGDQQDKGKQRDLMGMNTLIESDALKNGYLQKHVGIIFYGYETRPLAKAISYTTSPFIPGLSGNESNCVALLKKIGIPLKKGNKHRSLSDLNDEEKRTLFSTLSNHLVNQGYKTDVVHQLIGTIYTFRLEEPSTAQRSAREFASLLNACGRMDKAGLGISICLGDREESMEEAQSTVDEYRQRIGVSLNWIVQKEAIKELESIYVIQAYDNVEETVIGVVSSIILGNGTLSSNKPIIATAIDEDGQIKVSARGTEVLTSKGLHLGEVMQVAAKYVEGRGGGHDVAAGAFIPSNREEEFFEVVMKLVKERIQ
jgi:RecJ-like exonuclease